MLSWVHDREGWRSNGFVIQLLVPSRWALTEATPADTGPVHTLSDPLFVARTLTDAMREAELLAASRKASEQRRDWTVQFLAAFLAVFIAVDLAAPWNMFVSFALCGLALRALARMIASVITPWAGHPEDLFYQ